MTMLIVDPAPLARLVTWLAWILLNTLWQGAAIAALLWLTLRFLHEARSNVRYVLASTAMLAMVLAPVATGLALWGQPHAASMSTNAAAVPATIELPRTVPAEKWEVSPLPTTHFAVAPSPTVPGMVTTSKRVSTVSIIHSLRNVVDRYAGLLVASWLLGVALSAVRLWSSFRAVRFLRESATSVLDASLLQTFAGLAHRLNLDPRIRLMQSAVVRVPTVIGWLRPMVLLPIACLSGLSLGQIEALLAHELGHVKRHDYLINLLQNFVETVLFYHPCVWWISSVIHNEREHCCDAIALCLVSDRDLYANSLVQLATLATAPSQLALSASGGSLKSRIQRILNVPATASATSGPATALIFVFLATLVFVSIHVNNAGADSSSIESSAPTKGAGQRDELKVAQAETQATSVAPPAAKPAQPAAPARRDPRGGGPRGGGNGGAEIFFNAELKAVQKELGLGEDAAAKVKAIHQLFQKEIQATLPANGTRIRTLMRDGGGMTQKQEATRQGMPVFKAAVAKFRPQLKEVLSADQFTRLQQITWQGMGTGAFTDDELIVVLQITKDQQNAISAINDEYFIKRQEFNQRSGGAGALIGARETMALRAEEDTKIIETLSKELLDRFVALKGKSFELSQLRGRGRRMESVYGGGRQGQLWALVENEAVQKELGFTADEVARLKTLIAEFRAAILDTGKSSFVPRRLSEEEQKAEKEKLKKVAEANKSTTESFFPKLQATLTADQLTRLQQIHWQDIGTDAITDSEMIKELPVSNELQDKIKAIRVEFEAKQKKAIAVASDFQTKLAELDYEQDAKINETLTKAQHDQFMMLLGKEFDLASAQRERARASDDERARRRKQDTPDGNRRQGRLVYQRRQLFSLVENEAVQKDLGVNDADRIKTLGEEVRTAIREASGEPPNFEQMSPDERKRAKEEIENTDRTITAKFLPKLQEILTADQFTRLKQINWQRGGALQDPEVIEALSLSKVQQEKLQAIDADHDPRLSAQVYNANINTISSYVNTVGNTPEERQKAIEQHLAKINEVLTKEQQDKLTALKGKEFDFRLLRQ